MAPLADEIQHQAQFSAAALGGRATVVAAFTTRSISTRRIGAEFRPLHRDPPHLWAASTVNNGVAAGSRHSESTTRSRTSTAIPGKKVPSDNSSGNSNNSGNLQGLSRSFQSMFSRTSNERQRFVTGQFPVVVTVEENPTLQWLNLGRPDISTAVVLVNGTSIDRSLASFDRYQWLDDVERQELHDRYATVSVELLAEIHLAKPGYLRILPSNGAGSMAAQLRKEHVARAATVSTASSSGGGGGGGGGASFPFSWLQKRDYRIDDDDDDMQAFGADTKHDTNDDGERLWVTGFSLASRRGFIKSVDVETGHIDSLSSRSESMILWPNEVNQVPTTRSMAPLHSSPPPSSSSVIPPTISQDALLVSDGFLVPGKDRGGIYVVKNPEDKHSEWSICLTNPVGRDQWFYHRAIWVDLTGDGRLSVLTARAKLRKGSDSASTNSDDEGDNNLISRPKNGQLVWLEMPKPHHYDEATGTPLEVDGTAFDPFSARHVPWKERVLATGPDVMFAVADLDPKDDTIEVLASQFFDKKVTLHSIRRGAKPQVTFDRVIDDRCGAAYGGILADLDAGTGRSQQQVIDSGSTVSSMEAGDSFSHLLVTSHECDLDGVDVATSNGDSPWKRGNKALHGDSDGGMILYNGRAPQEAVKGGSLFAYRVPTGGRGAWRTGTWRRTTVATGFQVKSQLWNVINPGAPGFCYTFHAHKDDLLQGKRPMIAVAGDCAESAYIFRPQRRLGDPDVVNNSSGEVDFQAQYKLMCEIRVGGTCGSLAVGYGDLCAAEQESGYAKIYVPCFEKDKILVFALGSGEEDDAGW